MCSIDQQSTEHIALGLEEIARTCFRLALCLSFQKAVKHGRQNLSPAVLLARLWAWDWVNGRNPRLTQTSAGKLAETLLLTSQISAAWEGILSQLLKFGLNQLTYNTWGLGEKKTTNNPNSYGKFIFSILAFSPKLPPISFT